MKGTPSPGFTKHLGIKNKSKTAVLPAFLHWGCCMVTFTVHSVGPECQWNANKKDQEGIAYAMFHSYSEIQRKYNWIGLILPSFFCTFLLSMLISVHCRFTAKFSSFLISRILPAMASNLSTSTNSIFSHPHHSRLSSRVAIDIHQLKGRMFWRSQV